MDRVARSLIPVSILTLLLLSGISSACIGEVAGHLHFNVTQGGNQTLQMQIFNVCSNLTIDYTSFASIDKLPNMTTPNITISPRHGTLIPGQNFLLNVTVIMPSNAIVNTTWSGGLAAVESANVVASSGASVQGGVAKIITVRAIPRIVKPIPPIYIAAGLFVLLGALGSIFYKYSKPEGRRATKAKLAEKAILKKRMTYAEFKVMEAKKRASKPKRASKKEKAKKGATRRRRR